MNLDRISIDARIRSSWQAADLGMVLTRRWWKLSFLSWLIPAGITYLLLSLIFYDSNWLAITLVWWLKPLWDRGPLYVASRRLFGEKVTFAEVIRQLPKLYKIDFFQALTIRRLSLSRSMDTPVTILEQLKGEQRNRRLGILHRTYFGASNWLTIICVHVEVLAVIAIFFFLLLLIPPEVEFITWEVFFTDAAWLILINNTLSFICMAVVGPFYAIAGFSLYINRRIDLEAWDIEIRFRHMASAYQATLAQAC